MNIESPVCSVEIQVILAKEELYAPYFTGFENAGILIEDF